VPVTEINPPKNTARITNRIANIVMAFRCSVARVSDENQIGQPGDFSAANSATQANFRRAYLEAKGGLARASSLS
jgi:hypothetical protein